MGGLGSFRPGSGAPTCEAYLNIERVTEGREGNGKVSGALPGTF